MRARTHTHTHTRTNTHTHTHTHTRAHTHAHIHTCTHDHNQAIILSAVPAGGAQTVAATSAQDGVVWKDEEFSIEERRAQNPKYRNQVCWCVCE